VKLSTVFLNVCSRPDTYSELATWIWLSIVPFHTCDVCDVTLPLTPPSPTSDVVTIMWPLGAWRNLWATPLFMIDKHCVKWLIIFTRESSYFFQRILAIAFLSVCPSVCLSLTRVDQSKVVQAKITKSSSSAVWKTSFRNRKAFP